METFETILLHGIVGINCAIIIWGILRLLDDRFFLFDRIYYLIDDLLDYKFTKENSHLTRGFTVETVDEFIFKLKEH